jgi:hypothetical protein
MLYSMIPYKGRVLKIKEKGIVVNLGLIDGVTSGEKLVLYKMAEGGAGIMSQKRKIVFTVKEADTFLSYAETGTLTDLELLDSYDLVLPVNKRRAKRIK